MTKVLTGWKKNKSKALIEVSAVSIFGFESKGVGDFYEKGTLFLDIDILSS